MSLLSRLGRVWRGAGSRALSGADGAAAAAAPPFLYRGDLAGCRAIAEHTLAALSGESVEALHRLELLDAEGQVVQVVEERSRRPYVCLMPEPGGPPLGSMRVSLLVDPERLGPESAALLRQLPSAGRACGQLRRHAAGPWESVEQGQEQGAGQGPEGLSLPLSPNQPLRLALLNPAASAVTLAITAPGDDQPPTLVLPPGGARSLLLSPRSGTLLLRLAGRTAATPRPLVVLEPPEQGGAWRSLTL